MIQRFCGLALLAALVAAALAPTAHASKPRSEAERLFLTDMVSHHAMAVYMAELALGKSAHPELKVVAQEIVTEQNSQISRMWMWLRHWYNRNVEPMPSDDDIAMKEELESAGTPAEFEVRFMALMTMHHAQAIDRAAAIEQRRVHRKTRMLAKRIIDAQEREIAKMRTWLVAWYAN